MPIRAGSGGLKYALPNRAEIQARQNAAAASAGGSAASSAYSANRRYAGLKKQLQADFIQSGLDRGFRAQQNALDRGFKGHQAGLDRDFRADLQQKGIEADVGLLDKRLEFQGEQAGLDFERDVDLGYIRGIQTGNLELPPEAQQALRKLESGRANMKDLTPEQQAEFEEQYRSERRRIIRSARPRESPTASDTFNQGTIYVDPQGRGYGEPGEGRIPYNAETRTPLFEQPDQSNIPDPTEEYQTRRSDAANKFYQGLIGKTGADGEPITPEAAEAQTRQFIQGWERLNPAPQVGGGQVGTAGEQQGPRTYTIRDRSADPNYDPQSGRRFELTDEQGDVVETPLSATGQPATTQAPQSSAATTTAGQYNADTGTGRILNRMQEIQKQVGEIKDVSQIKDPKLKNEMGLLMKSLESQATGNPIPVKDEADAQKYPSGTRIITPDGKILEKD